MSMCRSSSQIQATAHVLGAQQSTSFLEPHHPETTLATIAACRRVGPVSPMSHPSACNQDSHGRLWVVRFQQDDDYTVLHKLLTPPPVIHLMAAGQIGGRSGVYWWQVRLAAGQISICTMALVYGGAACSGNYCAAAKRPSSGCPCPRCWAGRQQGVAIFARAQGSVNDEGGLGVVVDCKFACDDEPPC